MEIGTVQMVDIEQEMRTAYLDYAMSVIVARALPDARDGLKPVQRRILYAMYDMGLRPDAPYKKSARIVGEVLGKYHPHGDMAVYEAMARMAQDFALRYPLVDGQGNFGSVDGDSPAAMRYTEARLNRIALELLLDIDKDTVDWMDNFDGTLQEPAVLPARLPNLLVNGSAGIAVGMATNVPPHNLGEVCDALGYVIDHWEELDDVTVEDLMEYIEGPDFPTGGVIVGREGIAQAYATGHGRLVVRAMAHVEEMSGGRNRIVVTELPYQVNKSSLIERIAELAREGRIDTIADLRDESDRRGMSIVIELRRGADAQKTLNQLYKHTPLQTTFSVQFLALVNGEPRLLSLKRALQLYVEHRLEVLTRRSRYELEKARQRAHILEGLKTALDHLDAVIKLIRESPDADKARSRLMKRFKLSEAQAQAILDMQLRRLAALERQKIEDEYLELIQRIAYLEDLLASPRKMLYLIKEDVADLKRAYADGRRTRIGKEEAVSFDERDLIAEEDVVIVITRRGAIKRMPVDTYRRSLARGGREEDVPLYVSPARTLDSLLFFTNRGKVYQEKVYQIPTADRASRGVPLTSVVAVGADERVTAALAVPNPDVGARSPRPGARPHCAYMTLVTRQGQAKRVALDELGSVRSSGLIAIKLERGDELGWVQLTTGDDELLIVTREGQALRFAEKTLRPMGRAAGGVGAIKLGQEDEVRGVAVARPKADLFLVTTNGFGKRTPLSEFPLKGRNTRGVRCVGGRVEQTGGIAAACIVGAEDEVVLFTTDGVAQRIPAADVPRMGRATRGARLMELTPGSEVAPVAVLAGNGDEK